MVEALRLATVDGASTKKCSENPQGKAGPARFRERLNAPQGDEHHTRRVLRTPQKRADAKNNGPINHPNAELTARRKALSWTGAARRREGCRVVLKW